MARLPRKTQKIFCSAPNKANQTAVFGTMKTTNKQYSTDVATLQSNAAYTQGWNSATIAGYKPFMEEFNTLNYINTSQLAYLFQQGVAEWDSATTYYKNNFVAKDGLLYVSKTDNNTNHNPATDENNWEVFASGGKATYQPPLLSTMWSDHLLNDMSWLRADTFSWQSGTTYSAVYNFLLEALGTKVQMYCWSNADGSAWFWTLSKTPQAGDKLYGWGDEYVTCDVGTVNNVVDNNTIYLTTVLNPNDGSVVTLDTNFTRNSSKDKQSYTCHFERFNGITVYVNRRPNGLKIAMPNQETAILNKYNSDGIAWYYILDTANKRFKLPRTKFGFEGLRTSVGDDIKAGLPNITSGNLGYVRSGSNIDGSGALINTGKGMYAEGANANSSWSGTMNFDASRSNPIYGNSDTVQPPATQMYLYFYIGQYTPEAVEQTAGLNSELLNGKLDLNANNLDTDGKSLISGLGMPSSRYINLTLGASGSTYTAPANGYYCLMRTMTSQGYQRLTSTIYSEVRTHLNGGDVANFLPIKKGATLIVDYDGNYSGYDFRFVYAEGSK